MRHDDTPPTPPSVLIGGPLFCLLAAVLAGAWAWVAYRTFAGLERLF